MEESICVLNVRYVEDILATSVSDLCSKLVLANSMPTGPDLVNIYTMGKLSFTTHPKCYNSIFLQEWRFCF